MDFEHKPVLLDECIENLNIKPNGTYVDCTIGGAGHSEVIYSKLGEKGALLGLDQDEYALEVSAKRLREKNGKALLYFENTNFINIRMACEKNKIETVDGILMDLGVSSHQLDEAERGFSYQHDAPLDMRMDRKINLTAEKIVNEYSEEDIRTIITNYGEEKWSARIAAFIVNARANCRIQTTYNLVDIIKAAIPSAARREGPHPAKRTFQALRIAVNNELGILENAINEAVSLLSHDGRLCIITFHSLEDRIVKNAFIKKVKPCTCPSDFPICVCGKKPEAEIITRKPVVATENELSNNPRSRSAKLRVLGKI